MLLAVPRLQAQAPQISWARPLSGTAGGLFISDAAPDLQGNTIFTGSLTAPTLTFGNQTITNLSWNSNEFALDLLGPADAFVAKYTDSGSLLWVQHIGGSNGAYVSACAADNFGNIIIGGGLNSSNVWFGTNLITNTFPSNALFVAKLDAQGNLGWLRQLEGGPGPMRVAVDADANIHVAGEFMTNLVIEGSAMTNSYLVSDFVAEYSSAGELLWVNTVGFNASKDLDAVAVDAQGNTYLADCSSSAAYFGTTTVTNSGLLVAKYDPAGALAWVQRLSDASIMRRVAVGSQGELYLLVDGVMAKYDRLLNLIWTNSLSLNSHDSASTLILDPVGNPWVIGYGSSKVVAIGSLTLISSDPNPYEDPVLIAKYDPAGDLLWARLLYSSNANIFAVGVVDSTDSLTLYGEAYGTNVLDLDGIFVRTPTNGSGFFFTARIPGPSVGVQLLGAQIVISWPTNAVGLSLESAPGLSASNWSPFTNAPVIVGDQFSVTNNVSVGNQFYRLRNF